MRSEDSHVITHYYPAIVEEGSLTFLVMASPSNRPTPQSASIEASVPIIATASYPIV